jgi:hypothetical protein
MTLMIASRDIGGTSPSSAPRLVARIDGISGNLLDELLLLAVGRKWPLARVAALCVRFRDVWVKSVEWQSSMERSANLLRIN